MFHIAGERKKINIWSNPLLALCCLFPLSKETPKDDELMIPGGREGGRMHNGEKLKGGRGRKEALPPWFSCRDLFWGGVAPKDYGLMIPGGREMGECTTERRWRVDEARQ